MQTFNNLKTVSDLDILYLQNRVLFLDEEIDFSTSDYLTKSLLLLDSINNKPITLYINCRGGYCSDGFAIYDIMKSIKSPIQTIGLGHVASMAALILAAGTKGLRGLTKSTYVMLHQASGWVHGNTDDVVANAKHMERQQEQIAKVIIECTGQNEDKVKLDIQKDFYLFADEAKAYGLIDYIIGQ